MTRLRRGNYVFVTWKGDHTPQHVHVYKDARLVVKWNIESWVPMTGRADAKILRLLKELIRDGKL